MKIPRSKILSLLAIAFALSSLFVIQPAAAKPKKVKPVLVRQQAVPQDPKLTCSIFQKNTNFISKLSRNNGKRLFRKKLLSANTVRRLRKQTRKKIVLLKKLGLLSTEDKKSLKKERRKQKKLKRYLTYLDECLTLQNDNLFEQVYGIIETNCMGCHAPRGWINSEEYFRSSGLVIDGSPETSMLWAFLQGNFDNLQPANMPLGGDPLDPNDLETIQKWIISLKDPESPSESPEVIRGKSLYTQNCSSCHGSLSKTQKRGRTYEEIVEALNNVPEMQGLSLTDEDLQLIALGLSKEYNAPQGKLTIGDVIETEGNSSSSVNYTFPVILEGDTDIPFVVSYETANLTAIAGSDYRYSSGDLLFDGFDGEIQYVTVEVFPDLSQELDEEFLVITSNPSNFQVDIADAMAIGAIRNNDTYIAPADINLTRSENLIAYYNLDSSAHDINGIHNGLVNGVHNYLEGPIPSEGALELIEGDRSPADDYLELPGEQMFTGIRSFTFGANIFWRNNNRTETKIFDFGSSTTNRIYFTPRDSGHRCRLVVQASISQSVHCLGSRPHLPNNKWVHLAVTIDGNTNVGKIYFDGELVVQNNGFPDISPVNFLNNFIGRDQNSNVRHFDGLINNIAIWDVALSEQEINEYRSLEQQFLGHSKMQVRRGNTPINDGTIHSLPASDYQVEKNYSFYIRNNGGTTALDLTGTPPIRVAGANPESFTVTQQPLSYQRSIGNEEVLFVVAFTPTSPGEKNATLIIPNNSPETPEYAIALKATATGELPDIDEPVNDPELAEGITLYENNCSLCHGNLNQSEKLGSSVQMIQDAINSIPQMGSLSSLSQNDLFKISRALNEALPSGNEDRVSRWSSSLGTAQYLHDYYLKIFTSEAGNTGEDLAIGIDLSRFLLNNEAARPFKGGKCSKFSANCPTESTYTEELVNPNAIRYASIKRACGTVLLRDSAVINALSHVNVNPNQYPTEESLNKVFDLFFPGRPFAEPEHIINALLNFRAGQPVYDEFETWRITLDMLCVSGQGESS